MDACYRQLVLGIIGCLTGFISPLIAQETRYVRGEIISSNSAEPLRGVRISLRVGEELIGETQTDSLGRYQLLLPESISLKYTIIFVYLNKKMSIICDSESSLSRFIEWDDSIWVEALSFEAGSLFDRPPLLGTSYSAGGDTIACEWMNPLPPGILEWKGSLYGYEHVNEWIFMHSKELTTDRF